MNYGKPHIPFNSPLQFPLLPDLPEALPGAGGSGAHGQAKRVSKKVILAASKADLDSSD